MPENLKERIQEDMKDAMRNKETLRLTTIRMLLAAIKQREIDDKIELTDADILKIINKMIKQRQDASEQFIKGDRPELAEKENQEIEILQGYLPEQMSEADIEAVVKKAISETGAASMKDMGKVMGALKSEIEGRADMRLVSGKIKDLLNG
ncbi:MAG: GatB/YqeY domain-containing protein [Coxiellaceae bacterium]|nr:GatB/YqeY domain-containing protein [Coxiellaceae bacterium]